MPKAEEMASRFAAKMAAINVATPEENEQAWTKWQDLRNLTLPGGPSWITSRIALAAYTVLTTAIDTLAVALGSDGLVIMMVNPQFLLKVESGLPMIVCHECVHLLVDDLYVSATLKKDPVHTVAVEAYDNYLSLALTGLRGMPIVDGKASGVDPDQVRRELNADRKKRGLEPLAAEQIYRSSDDCYRYLREMEKPPKDKGGCVFVFTDDGDPAAAGDGSGHPMPTVDPEAAGKLAQSVLETALGEALAGDNQAREELLKLMDATGNNEGMTKLWGNIGAERLRGAKTGTRKSNAWKTWTMNAIGSRLQDGQTWMVPPKLAAVHALLRQPVPIRARGKTTKKKGLTFCDVSGSMSRQLLDQLAPMMTQVPELDNEFYDFDVHVAKVGEQMRDGGGTNFSCIERFVEDYDDDVDFVLVITDGYAPQIQPKNSQKWIWLIVPGGDEWPKDVGMKCLRLEPEDLG